jgi:hypothetical protein
MSERFPTRTWRHEATNPDAIVQVTDPAVREILRIVSRSLKAICAAIDRHTGPSAAADG